MPAISAKAPAKTILLGEHAVVYGRPAIAVPVHQVYARTVVIADPLAQPDLIRIEAKDIGLNTYLSDLETDNPFVVAIESIKNKFSLNHLPASHIVIHSTIPRSAGLGSSAAVAVSLIRAYTTFLGLQPSAQEVSELAYEVEKVQHGTPSGIDNTVIAFETPIVFQKNHLIRLLQVGSPLTLLIADSGIPGSTKEALTIVRERWQSAPDLYEQYFDQIAGYVTDATEKIRIGDLNSLGNLMTQNHAVLQQIGVSSPELDRFVDNALENGALGAKMCGGGLGGNMIALVKTESVDTISNNLFILGAKSIICTTVKNN
ncbi:MAG: mevalonate kinase [Anaerolineaceae bacterium]